MAVCNQENLRRGRRLSDPLQFDHHLLVDVQPASRVDQDRVIPGVAGVTQSVYRPGNRIIVVRFVEISEPVFRTQNPQLLDRSGAVYVDGQQKRRVIVLRQPEAEFRGRRCLSGSLQADHQEDTWRRFRKIEPGLFAPEKLHEFIADYLDDLLPGVSD